MDIKLPGMSGIQCVTEIKKVAPNMQIIMVTVYEDSERIFRALKAGANGVLVKVGIRRNNSWPRSVTFTRAGAPMSSHIASKVVKHFHLVAIRRSKRKIYRRGSARFWNCWPRVLSTRKSAAN